jgi:hypothetical protein
VLIVPLLACSALPSGNTHPVGGDAGGADTQQTCLHTGPMRDTYRCGCDADCMPGARCSGELSSGFPGGFCARPCNNSSACPAGERCIAGPGGAGICILECHSKDDCGPGDYCDTKDLTCGRQCAADGDCSEGKCDTYSGQCVAEVSTTGGALGATCLRHDDCRSGSCDPTTNRCRVFCVVSRAACPEGAVCVEETPGNELGVCRLPCGSGTCADPTASCVSRGPGGTSICVPASIETGCLDPSTMTGADGNCACQRDCQPRATCSLESDSGSPRGRCVELCESAIDCGAGNVCVTGMCMHNCVADTDCPVGSYCQLPSDCFSGQCNLYSGYCEPTPTAGAAMGAACVRDNQCRSGNCFDFCTALCNVHVQTCPDGTFCADDGNGDSAGLCVPACQSAGDCPQDFSCMPRPDRAAGSYCAPPPG